MGEHKRRPMGALAKLKDGTDQPQVVDTLGGRMHIRWDEGAAATPHGQLAGHRCYAHITALRGDAVAAQALGMNKVVSEDALRRALERIDEASSTAWMRPALMHFVRQALDKPWVLDVQVNSGKQHTSVHAKAALGRLLDELGDGPDSRCPALVRGDSGYGNEGILLELERRDQPYLLRLRQTANVQRLVAQQFARQDWSRADNQGCQMAEDWLQLHGWSKKRRVVIVRQRIRGGIACERRVDGKQLQLDLAGPSVVEGERLWEYAVMVTDVKYPLEAITSRPLLLAAVGTVANHAGQTTLYLTPLHGKANTLKPLIANIRAALQQVKDTAEQFKVVARWAVLLRYVSDRIAPTLGTFRPPDVLPATG